MRMDSGFRNHDDPGLSVDRLLRTAAIQRTQRKRRWPGYAIAFSAGWLSALALLVIVGLMGG